MRRLTTVLFATAFLAPTGLLGQGPPSGPRAGMGMGMGMGPRMGAPVGGPNGGAFSPQMLLNRRQRLQLTDDQAIQLEALATEIRKAHDEAATAAKPHEEKLRELWQADKPDVQAIQSEMQALMTARHGAALAAASAAARAKGLLTAEQRGRVEGWADGRGMGARGPDRGMRRDGPRRGMGFRMQPRMRRF
jgi:Spy/CpxP family protein refolding chaperone